MMRWGLGILLAISAGSGSAVSLVLRDGTLLDYGTMSYVDQPAGSLLKREFAAKDPVVRRIELPDDSQGIHRVVVDAVAHRIYVTPQLSIGRHGTLIVDQDSLRVIGFLPGIIQVIVPVHPTARRVMVQRVIVDDPEVADRLRVSAEQTPTEALSAFPIRFEQISRAHPERLAAARVVEPGTSLLACAGVRGRGYPGGTRVDDKNESMTKAKRSSEQKVRAARLSESAERGFAVECWPDGSLLRQRFDRAGGITQWAVEQPDGTLGDWVLSAGDSIRPETLGDMAPWAMMDGALLNMASGQRPGFALETHWIRLHGGGSAAYFGSRHYDSKGGTSSGWLETGPARIGASVTIVEIVGDRPAVGELPLGPAIERVQALRALDERIAVAVTCDSDGVPTEAQEAAGLSETPLECRDPLVIERAEFSDDDDALAKQLPAIEVVGVVSGL